MKIQVNISTDFTLGLTAHFGPIPPIPEVGIEGALQCWFPGMFTGQNQFTRTVKHGGRFIMLEGHDIGMLIPHITLPLVPNPWLLKIIPLSSRKASFASSIVKMNGKGVGAAGLLAGMPMLACGEPVSTPTAFPLTNTLNTVIVGLVPLDIQAGIAGLAVSLVVDAAFCLLGGNGFKLKGTFSAKNLKEIVNPNREMARLGAKKIVKEKAFKESLGEAYRDLFLPKGKVREAVAWVARKAADGLSDLATSSLQGNPTYKLKWGHDALGAEASFGKDEKGGTTQGGKATVGPLQSEEKIETGEGRVEVKHEHSFLGEPL
jgi:hypothetical protein